MSDSSFHLTAEQRVLQYWITLEALSPSSLKLVPEGKGTVESDSLYLQQVENEGPAPWDKPDGIKVLFFDQQRSKAEKNNWEKLEEEKQFALPFFFINADGTFNQTVTEKYSHGWKLVSDLRLEKSFVDGAPVPDDALSALLRHVSPQLNSSEVPEVVLEYMWFTPQHPMPFTDQHFTTAKQSREYRPLSMRLSQLKAHEDEDKGKLASQKQSTWFTHEYYQCVGLLNSTRLFDVMSEVLNGSSTPQEDTDDLNATQITNYHRRQQLGAGNYSPLFTFDIRDDGILMANSLKISATMTNASQLVNSHGSENNADQWMNPQFFDPVVEAARWEFDSSLGDLSKAEHEKLIDATIGDKKHASIPGPSHAVFESVLWARSVVDYLWKVIGSYPAPDGKASPLWNLGKYGDPQALGVINYVGVRKIAASDYPDNQQDPTSSYYINDLHTLLKNSLEGKELPAVVKQYVDTTIPQVRLDITAARLQTTEGKKLEDFNAKLQLHLLDPAYVPHGRWPSKPQWGQSIGQQIAVNTIHSTFLSNPHSSEKNAGASKAELNHQAAYSAQQQNTQMLGVNGPPGTGKSTMLQDVIADIIVERARAIASVTRSVEGGKLSIHAWKGFQHGEPASSNPKYQKAKFFPLNPAITGYEMLIASNNNKAVENLSKELPTKLDPAVFSDWLALHTSSSVGSPAQNTYFKDTAALLIDRQEVSDDILGVISVVLGKQANRKVASAKIASSPLYDSLTEIAKDKARAMREGILFSQVINAFAPLLDAEGYYRSSAEQSFNNRNALFNASHGHEVADNQAIAQAQSARTSLQAQQQQIAQADAATQAQLNALSAQADALVAQQNDSFAQRMKRAFSSSARQQEADYQNSVNAVLQAKAQEANNHAAYLAQANALTSQIAQQNSYIARIEKQNNNAQQLHQLLESIRLNQAAASFYALPHSDSQAAAKLETEWRTARNRVFLEALNLHQSFILANAYKVKVNLDIFLQVLKGRSKQYTPEAVQAAWQTFFLVFPTASTTFAASASLLRNLPDAALGYVLIDEAGQALPQQAMSVLRKVRHAIAMGDPAQLEPVDTFPVDAKFKLATFFGLTTEVDGHPTLKTASVDNEKLLNNVQQMIDSHTPVGMMQRDFEGKSVQWLGIPLAVNRRNNQEMIDICNRISYDGRMQKPHDWDAGNETLPPSQWITEESSQQFAGADFSGSEESQVANLLAYLHQQGKSDQDLLMLSPYRDVGKSLQRALMQEFHIPYGQAANIAGTVHVSQGKEATVVVFVLSGKSRPFTPGRCNWVNEKPNLINVAVSRAKRRFYVIGNKQDWLSGDYTRVMAEILDEHLARELAHSEK